MDVYHSTGWTAEKSPKGEVWCKHVPFVDVEGDKILKKMGKEKKKESKLSGKAQAAEEKAQAKVKAEEDKAAKKLSDKARKEVRAFETKLIALLETAPDSEPHPLDSKALDLLKQSVKKIAEQTGEWEAAAAEDDEPEAEPEPEPEPEPEAEPEPEK